MIWTPWTPWTAVRSAVRSTLARPSVASWVASWVASVACVVAAAVLLTSGLACGGSNAPASQSAELKKDEAPAATRLPANAPSRYDPLTTQPSAHAAPTGPIGPAAPRVSAQTAPPATTPPPLPTLNIPPDAQWTIYCYEVKGADHVNGSNASKAQLVAKTGRNDWYIIHGRETSNIYFGFYRSVQAGQPADVAESNRAQTDLRMIKDLRTNAGVLPFQHAAFVSLSAPDPTAPPEWNLFNVDRALAPKDPKRAYWSLQVMAFRANEKRKEAAVEAVRDLRSQGVEAFYYHGESVSSVCVGRWPANALKSQNRTDEIKDTANITAESNLVVSTIPLEQLADPNAPALKPKQIDNKKTVAVAPKFEFLDPTIRETMAKFPYHAVNYEDGKEVNGQKVMNSSFLVVIPRAKGNGLYDSDVAPVTAQGDTPVRQPTGPNMLTPRERVDVRP